MLKYFCSKNVVFLIVMAFFGISVFAQKKDNTSSGNAKIAKDNFELQDYKNAINDYLILIKKDSTNTIYNYRLGVCYLNTNIDKLKAISCLEYVVEQPKYEVVAWYELGRAYQLAYRFDDAISAYKKFKEVSNGKSYLVPIPADRQIEMCYQAQELIKDSIDVTFENLGPEVNSAYPEFRPYVPADESFIVFSSKRAGNNGGTVDYDGFMTSDIYFSFPDKNKWIKAKNAGVNINSPLVEETAGLSADGNKLFVFIDNYNGVNDIFISTRKGKIFQKAVSLSDNINTEKYEGCATISLDKKTIYFSSDIIELSGKDIFMINKLPNNEWSKPIKLGDNINTIYDEEAPNLSPDGKTLYFASCGHNSMGNFDIFKSVWDEQTKTWGEAVNMGFPINTPDNEVSISFSASGRHAYVSALRKNGYGDLDIYKCTFNKIAPTFTIVKCSLLGKDSLNIFAKKEKICTNTTVITTDSLEKNKNNVNNKENKNNINKSITDKNNIATKTDILTDTLNKPQVEKDLQIQISITDKIKKKDFGNYLPNKQTGRVVIILPPGEYTLSITGNGLKNYTEDINITEKAINSEMLKSIYLLSTN